VGNAGIVLCCPVCRVPARDEGDRYHCTACGRSYPVLHGIPDFRLRSDLYLGLAQERAKAARIATEARRRPFEELLDYYYQITDDVPPELARRYRASVLGAPRHLQELGAEVARSMNHKPSAVALDAGCGAGGMLVVLSKAGVPVVGLDIALRWLVICRKRLDELGIGAMLVCGDLEQPPFLPGTFDAVTAIDMIEHVRDVPATLASIGALMKPDALSWLTASNSRTPGPHPTTRIWGIGWLARPLRSWLLRRLRGVDSLRFSHLLTPGQLGRLSARSGLTVRSAAPRRIGAPDSNYSAWERWLMRCYTALARAAPTRRLMLLIGPSFELVLCRKACITRKRT
jgi:SAM-dependent methyltransferase